MCSFYVTSEYFNVVEPKVISQMVRDHGLGAASLAATLTQDGGDPSTYRFPDDSVLVMIGETPHLVGTCQAAHSAGVHSIKTSGNEPLALKYVRIKVGPFTTNTLVAVGAARLISTAGFTRDWHEYVNLSNWYGNNHLRMTEGGVPNELPLAIRWIKENDGDGWVKV